MKIDKSKLGNIQYGRDVEKQLKELYKDKKIVDVQYNYLAECFDFILDNGEVLTLEV